MNILTRLLKFTDSAIGPIICSALSKSQTSAETRTLSDFTGPILVIRPGGIGDAVMLLPTIRYLRSIVAPTTQIDILCETRNMELFKIAVSDVNLIVYDKSPIKTIRVLRQRKYSVVIDTEQFHNFSGVMTGITGAELRVGFKVNTNRNGLYTHIVSYDFDGSEDAQFMRLINAVQPPPHSQPAKSGILSRYVSVPQFTLPHDIKQKEFLALHAGGSIPCKQWMPERFAKVCDYVSDKYSLPTILIGGKSDCKQAEKICAANSKPINLCGKLTLAETVSLCRQAKIFIGSDSGIAHIATAVDTPVVALFGPSDPNKWGVPKGTGSVIHNALPCSPCSIFGYTKPCKNHECMLSISPEQVITEVCKILENEIL